MKKKQEKMRYKKIREQQNFVNLPTLAALLIQIPHIPLHLHHPHDLGKRGLDLHTLKHRLHSTMSTLKSV